MLFLYAATLFVSATLLFWIQPMFSKMVLPLLGGTPGVWNTCMVFYQGVLLVGYATTHALIHRLGVKRQALLHCLLLCGSFFFLPIAIHTLSQPPVEGAPVLWLLGLMAVCIGWPFWVISSTAPMLQYWFSQTRHRQAKDPYFLYAASNTGSLFALLGYPVLIEPMLRLSQQVWAWSAGYAILVGLTFLCAAIVWRSPTPSIEESRDADPHGISVKNSDRLRWFLLSLVPSSLLLGVTTYITTDVAAVPLLWVVPLAIYLTTFIIVFSQNARVRVSRMVRIQPYLLAPPILLFFWGSKVPLAINFPIHLFAFFVHAMVCHGELARRRPPSLHLTEFYLWMAAGGVAGGLVNAIAAPWLFRAPLEYPLAIAAAAMLRSRVITSKPNTRRFAYGLLAGLAILLLGPLTGNPDVAYHIGIVGLLVVTSLFVAYFYAYVNRPVFLGIVLAIGILVGFRVNDAYRKVLHRERGFFGPLLVRMNPEEDFYLFYHGTTLHGAQSRLLEDHMHPMAYFTKDGPFGNILNALNEYSLAPRRMAITGLGAGTIAAYGRAGDQIDYYEIDPNVVHVARDTRFFTFLRDTPATLSVILGDARLTLAQAPDESYDAIIMDAFSSGSIPIHLLTREAFSILHRKMKPDGVLVYQITNRYLNLEPVLASLAEEAGCTALIRRNLDISDTQKRAMVYPSVWVILTTSTPILDYLANGLNWETLLPTPGFTPWTDDFSNLLSVLKPPRWN